MPMKQHIYADNAATTQLDKSVFEAMTPFILEEYGNASQLYTFARKPKKAIADSRAAIAECIGALPEEIFFTSGGTEGDNWMPSNIMPFCILAMQLIDLVILLYICTLQKKDT